MVTPTTWILLFPSPELVLQIFPYARCSETHYGLDLKGNEQTKTLGHVYMGGQVLGNHELGQRVVQENNQNRFGKRWTIFGKSSSKMTIGAVVVDRTTSATDLGTLSLFFNSKRKRIKFPWCNFFGKLNDRWYGE
jgi:hypothetical protein